MKGSHHRRSASQRNRRSRHRISSRVAAWILLPVHAGMVLGSLTTLAQAQMDQSVQKQEDQLIRQFTPPPPAPAPVYQPPAPAPAPAPPPAWEPAPAAPSYSAPAAEPATQSTASPPASRSVAAKSTSADRSTAIPYVLKFDRSPVVGNSMRLRGTYAEGRLGFTRPRNWTVKSAQALIRFQHSPALIANRSNLTVRVNGTSVGSVPLKQKQSKIGEVLVTIPLSLLQNYNEITLVAQQNNSPTCSDPADPNLWTEVLPDSKLLFNFQQKAIPLDFSRYPYPFFDDLSLDRNQITYLVPKQVNESWLTSTAQFHAGMGRLSDFRSLDTRLAKTIDQVPKGQRLVVIGTLPEQAALKSLKLPYKVAGNQFVDGGKNPLPEDVGLVMLTTTQDTGVPVLVITGNGPEGVAKAVQFLLQSPQRSQLGTGSAILVDQLEEVASPDARQWPRYLPASNAFTLADLKAPNNKPFQDVTVRGSYAPPVEVDFRALPDDRFQRGSTMTLYYSHSPQVNPRLSTVEVQLDGKPIGGKRLTSDSGANRDSVDINIPPDLVKPNSKLQVAFNLVPKELGDCGRTNDQQLWGTVHQDTKFNLNRTSSAQLPDLKLLQAGYPFAAPQDLSTTAIAVPASPTNTELLTLLEVSERLGRLSQAPTVKLKAYTAGTLPEEVRKQAHLIGIGNRQRFPFPDAFKPGGFQLKDLFVRQAGQNQVQTLPDTGGVVKQVVSPWNGDRVLLALTAQSDAGLAKVRDVFERDVLFFQLKDDTVVVNTTEKNPSPYDANAYSLAFFQEATQKRRLESASLLGRTSGFLQENWYLLPTGMVTSALIMYGLVQLYLKRLATPGDHK